MKRKALFIGLLQSLSFFASVYSDSNGTSMDHCIDADMEKIMEYTETLEYSSSNVSVVTDDGEKNLLPFGALKTDWTRLHLLHEALPSDSVLKPKFKYLLRLLLIAHEQTNRFAVSSQLKKIHDKIVSKTTVSIPIEVDENIQEIDKQSTITEYETMMNSTERSQEFGTKFQDFSSTISLVSPKYDKDNVDTVIDKNSSQRTNVQDNEEETAVKSNISEKISTIRLPLVIATSNPILDISKTDKHNDDLSVNKTPILITENPNEFSTVDEIVRNEKKNSTIRPAPVMSSVTSDYSPITVAFSSFSDKKENPTSTEMFVKQEIENFSSTSSTPIEMNTKWDENRINDTLSYQASTTTISTVETSADENFLSTTVLNFVSTQILDSTSRKNDAITKKSTESSSPKELSNTRPAERKWSYGNPSSTTVSSSDTTEVLFSTSTKEEAKSSASTIEKNLTVVPVTTMSSVSRNITTGEIKNEELSSTHSPVQSTRKVERSSEKSARPIIEYSSTLSSTNVYTGAIIQSITYPIEKVPIASTQDNEEPNLDHEKKFATTEKNREISNSTRDLNLISENSTAIPVNETNGIVKQPIDEIDKSKFEPVTEIINNTRENIRTSTIKLNFVFDDSTISTSTKNHSDESSTPAIEVKETNSPSEKESIDKIETSTNETVTKKNEDVLIHTGNPDITAGSNSTLSSSTVFIGVTNYSDKPLTNAILEKKSNLTKDNKSVDKIETSSDEPTTEKIEQVSIDTGNHSTVRVISHFSNSTVSSSTRNYTNEKSTPVIFEKDENSTSENQPIEKIGTSKDESVTKKIECLPSYTGSSTFPPTVTNSTDELLTTVIIKKETNLPSEKPVMNKTEISEEKPVTENINYSITRDAGTTSQENKNISNTKLIYVKNYLHAVTPSDNNISKNFKHEFKNVDKDEKKSESPEIILFESGAGAITGNTWRPHILWKQPVENNIRRYDKFPNPLERYGYQRLPSMKSDIDVGSGRSVKKWPYGNRTNLLRTGKRGSVNADIEKQFRSYYREGKINPSKKSRIDENHNSKIVIQCKNV